MIPIPMPARSIRSGRTTSRDYIHVFDGNSALFFNGWNGSVLCQEDMTFNPTQALSIEAWIYPEGWGQLGDIGFGRIVDKGQLALFLIGTHPAYPEHCLGLQLVHADGTTSHTTTLAHTIHLETWQHVAATYDAAASEVTLYINGVRQIPNSMALPSGPIAGNGGSPLIIGNNHGGGLGFDGRIDELSLWEILRTGDDICRDVSGGLHGDEADLLGYWMMNEGSGTTVLDQTQFGRDGAGQNVVYREGVSPELADMDTDDDGIIDCTDNCPEISNPAQMDGDGDGIGDVCEGLRGDADGNGRIDVLDAIAVINHILGNRLLDQDALLRTDCNSDGIIDVRDVIGIINILLGT